LEAQFLRSQRMEGIGTLATGMAHDLNNILAPILMSAGALRWDLTPKDHEVAISRIEMSVKRAADIIQQVLTFGRGVSGDRVAIDARDLMEEAAKIMVQTFPKNITIDLEADSDLWPILGDKTQIHQVLLNLAINSRDAMPNGGTITLKAEKILVDELHPSKHAPVRAGSYVMVQVTDTGTGISPAVLERIFDPFFTTKELGKGTGLGLSTVLGIVKSHHGSVSVESEVDRGTSFKVLLPASPETAKNQASGNSSVVRRGNGEVILLVDDEASIVSSTRRMLEQFGYKVHGASNGKEALTVISQLDQVDLVLTDIMMPQMDGMALIRELREKKPQIKIIASSGLGASLDGSLRKNELAALGVMAFLNKPYSSSRLLDLLREILGEKIADDSASCNPALENSSSDLQPESR
jgi:two-component system cell cycle sensor histidine kinase/response regulator CckA